MPFSAVLMFTAGPVPDWVIFNVPGATREMAPVVSVLVFDVPPGIEIAIDKQTHITVTGVDRQLVGQVAANIRRLREPDPYKQKGVRYTGEVLKKKAGKTGAK